MKKITLKDFKSLISWLSADEMIDMIPEKLSKKLNYNLNFAKAAGRKDVILILLLRLFTNNYLSYYQLITDETT